MQSLGFIPFLVVLSLQMVLCGIVIAICYLMLSVSQLIIDVA